MARAIPVGLIGAGKHGARYLRHIAEDVPELRITLLCRRNEAEGREQAHTAGARFVGDWRELAVSREIGAVIAVVPPTLHEEISRVAAGAGKAILLEKPLAPTVAAGVRIREAVDRAGVPAMIAHTLRYNAVVGLLRDRLPAIGAVVQVVLSQRFEPSRLEWLDDPAISGGGMILHTGVHGFDLVRVFAGALPDRAAAVAARAVTRGTEDDFSAVFGWDGRPLTASVSGCRATASRSLTIEIAGEKGQLVGDLHHGSAAFLEGTTRVDLGRIADVPTVREALRGFAAALRDGTAMPIPLADGLGAVAMAQACYRSLASGRAEAVRGGQPDGRQ